jgi:hypothetical protein
MVARRRDLGRVAKVFMGTGDGVCGGWATAMGRGIRVGRKRGASGEVTHGVGGWGGATLSLACRKVGSWLVGKKSDRLESDRVGPHRTLRPALRAGDGRARSPGGIRSFFICSTFSSSVVNTTSKQNAYIR